MERLTLRTPGIQRVSCAKRSPPVRENLLTIDWMNVNANMSKARASKGYVQDSSDARIAFSNVTRKGFEGWRKRTVERREGCRHRGYHRRRWEVLVQATEAVVADAGG